MSTLAEILAEGKRLEEALGAEFAAGIVRVARPRDVREARKRRDAYYAEHFSRLARVAEAANVKP